MTNNTPPGRRRTINHRPLQQNGQEPIKINLGPLWEAFEGASIELDGLTARLIIRVEVIEVELELKFHEPEDLSEESPDETPKEEEENQQN